MLVASTILSTIAYVLYATIVCCCCGLITYGILKHNRACASPERCQQLAVADFLLGSGLGLWCISIIQLGLLIVCSGLPPYGMAAASCLIAVAALYALRTQAREMARDLWSCLSRDRASRMGAGFVLGAVLVVAGFSVRATLIPLWHGDILLYATEAKALRDARDYAGRLPKTPQPNAQNYIRMNDHPITFIGYMSSGLFFSPERTQDLPLRAALQFQNIILMAVLVGAGLRLGGMIGVLAPLFLLYYHYFGTIIDMSHRESFRVIPVLLCFGFLPAAGERLRFHSARAGLLLASMLFLWGSHSGSLAIAPVVMLAQAVVVRGWSSRVLLVALCALGLLFGASHHLDAYLTTGSLFGHQFWGVQMAHLHTPKIWRAPPPPPAGFSFLFEHFINQWHTDGAGAVLGLLLGVAGAGFALLRRRPLATPILAAAIFCFINEIEVLGLMDWVHPRLSPMLFTVARYRFVLYPLGALLFAALVLPAAGRLSFKKSSLVGCLLLAGGLVSALVYWERSPMKMQLVRDDTTLSYLDPMKSCWGAVAANIGTTNKDLPVIVTESAMIPWYYTDWNVLTLVDPRLQPALMAQNAAEAQAELDKLHVGVLVLNKANVLSGTAIEEALHAQGYEKFIDCIYDVAYRRVSPAAP